jgi:hypothetical protein
MLHDNIMGENTPRKRKRGDDDVGDRAQKKVCVSEKYLVCKTRKAPFYLLSAFSPPAGLHCALTVAHVPSSCSFQSSHVRKRGRHRFAAFYKDVVNVLMLQRTLFPDLKCRTISSRCMA